MKVFTRAVGGLTAVAAVAIVAVAAIAEAGRQGGDRGSSLAQDTQSIDVDSCGAAGDSRTDDAAAFRRCAAALPKGGTIRLTCAKSYFVSDLPLAPMVGIRGCLANPEVFETVPSAATDYGRMGGKILLSPAGTITGAKLSGLADLTIMRAGMTIPSSNSSAYAGTAITLPTKPLPEGGQAVGFYARNVLVMGFARCVDGSSAVAGQGNPHLAFERFRGDCTDGETFANSFDTSVFRDIHNYPYGTFAYAGTRLTGYSKSGDRVTLSFAPGESDGYAAGETVQWSNTGVQGDEGRYTVVAATPSSVTFVDAAATKPPGKLKAQPFGVIRNETRMLFRHGTGFETTGVSDDTTISNIMDFGHDDGVRFHSNGDLVVDDVWTDNNHKNGIVFDGTGVTLVGKITAYSAGTLLRLRNGAQVKIGLFWGLTASDNGVAIERGRLDVAQAEVNDAAPYPLKVMSAAGFGLSGHFRLLNKAGTSRKAAGIGLHTPMIHLPPGVTTAMLHGFTAATDSPAGVPLFDGAQPLFPTLASAPTLDLPTDGASRFSVTGTQRIDHISGVGDCLCVTLILQGASTITSRGNVGTTGGRPVTGPGVFRATYDAATARWLQD